MKTDQGNQANDSNNDRRKEARTNTSNGREQAKAYTASNQASSSEKGEARMSSDISSSTRNSSPVILEKMLQGTPEWHEARRGRITMSNAKALVSQGRKKGEPSLTRASYLIDVASEIITGVTADRYKSWEMERGNILEPFAMDAYRDYTGFDVREVGLGYLNEDRRISCSPDALGSSHGVEVKCQHPKNHLATIVNGFEPKQFVPQMQGGIWIFDFEYWDYVSFCPELKEQPIFVHRVYRDEEMIKSIEESALKGVYEIDELVRKGRDFKVNNKINAICEEAILTIETLRGDEPEIF